MRGGSGGAAEQAATAESAADSKGDQVADEDNLMCEVSEEEEKESDPEMEVEDVEWYWLR